MSWLKGLKAELLQFRDDFSESLSSVFTRPPSQEWLNKRRLEELEIKRQELALSNLANDNANPSIAAEPIVWKGAKRELANEIIRLRDTGQIEAPADDKLALEQYVPHFVWKEKNGEIKAIDIATLWKNYSEQLNSKSR